MSNEKTERRLSRRHFTKLGLGAAAAVFGGSVLSGTAAAGHHEEGEGDGASPLVTDVPDNASLLAAVQYVAVSEIDGKNCANCQLLLQRDGDVGRCGLFQKGKVPVAAYCTSWIKKAGT